jgi:hypothetical protein
VSGHWISTTTVQHKKIRVITTNIDESKELKELKELTPLSKVAVFVDRDYQYDMQEHFHRATMPFPIQNVMKDHMNAFLLDNMEYAKRLAGITGWTPDFVSAFIRVCDRLQCEYGGFDFIVEALYMFLDSWGWDVIANSAIEDVIWIQQDEYVIMYFDLIIRELSKEGALTLS